MTCAECGHENRAGRKFCAECGAGLALACGTCSAPYEAGEKFCGECGASLGVAKRASAVSADATGAAKSSPPTRASADGGARKIVTIVFADLVGSTTLHERLDAESAQRVMERYYDALRAAVEAHDGTVVKLLGDGVMAAFGLRQVAEDDALRAVHAAVAMQEAFRELASAQPSLAGAGLRVAVNTGEVVVSGALDDVIGDPVNVAARLQEQARDGGVVVGEATRRLVASRVTLAPLGRVTLKGRAEAVGAYRVDSLDAPAATTAAPFVGRDEELTRLGTVYDAAVAAPAARLAVLLGSPGLGKSRLIDELGRRLGESVTLLLAHCDAAGGATFAPLATALRTLLGIDDAAGPEAIRAGVESVLASDDGADRGRIAGGVAALLAGSPAAPEETFFVVRRLLASLAREKPVVLVIDDIHWAEPLLLDLVEHLIQWGGGAPLFVLVGARPELRDLRSALVTPGGLVSDVVTLGGLDAGAAMRLAANVIGASDLPAAVAAKVLATSEGNPLFVGELVRMLVEEGALTKEGERWTAGAGLAAIEMPPTIHALLAARIERLRPEERTVLERASVVGRHFSRSAVAALLGKNGSELDARLETLRRSELIERDPGWLLGEPVLRFHHVLIRDAAYRRLLKETRAELHERLADWMEAQVGDAPEHDETIGWHLEQAHQHLRELGELDARGRSLGERAAKRLAAAGRRALARDDVPLAAGLLGRAIDRLDAADVTRADLALDWCEALLSAGDVVPAAGAISELERFAEGSERIRGWHTCFAGQLAVMTAPEDLHAAAERVAAAACDLAKLDDAAGEAKAHFVNAQALARLGKVGACEAALDQALAAARRAGDRRRANAVLAGAPLAALWGPSPVTRASGRCLDVVRVLRITQGAPAVEAVALSCQGVLEALRGRTDAARRMLTSSRTMVEELGITQRLFEVDVFIGRVDLLESNAAAAERALRPAYEGFRDLGLGIDAARAAALLGRALLEQNRAAEAEQISHESELLAGDDLEAAIAWRGVRAEALAARGGHAAAIELANAAVDIAAATDALLHHAAARVALAAALRAAGRASEANAESQRARELWEAKGATLLVERAGRAAGQTAAAAAVDAPRPVAPPAPVSRRRVRPIAPNAVTERAAEFERIVGDRDFGALESFFADGAVCIDHPTGTTYGADGMRMGMRRLMQSPDARLCFILLGTLGPSWGLVRREMSASGTTGARFDVGPYEIVDLAVQGTDGFGRLSYVEVFPPDRLGDAIARLYECFAESLPEGASHARATVTARAVAYMLTSSAASDLGGIYAQDYVDVDHRNVGYGALSSDELGRIVSSLDAVAENTRFRVDDVLALSPAGLVRKATWTGAWREGGGSFERSVCTLSVFGADGRITRHETFDADREAEALARFDALTAEAASVAPKRGLRRSVRPNAATKLTSAIEAAFDRRDLDAIAALLGDPLETIEHPTGVTYGREGQIESSRRMMRLPDMKLRCETLATLGESLVLFRRMVTASGASGGRFDVGAYEVESCVVGEVDETGRLRRSEVFASDHLCQATGRLYARYAETLPEGPERVRFEGIARSHSIWNGSPAPEVVAGSVTPTYALVDHRPLGTWSCRGREGLLEHWRGQLELASSFSRRDDDILAFAPGANVLRQTYYGTSRASGGPFENVFISVNVFDANGFSERFEIFELDQEVEALARFDELTAGTTPVAARRRVRANVASLSLERFRAALAARDSDIVAATFDESVEVVHHPTAAVYGRRQLLTTWRSILKAAHCEFRGETLATLGDTLALDRHTLVVEGFTEPHLADVGRMEHEELTVIETDGAGRWLRVELFAAEHLDDAMMRLYEIHAERLPEGPARDRGTAAARARATHWRSATDPDRFITSLAPAIVAVDHRTVGFGNLSGAEAVCAAVRTILDLSYDVTWRMDDLVALSEHASVVRATQRGHLRAGGGKWERPLCSLTVHDEHGLISRWEIFEPEREAEALARYDELVGTVTPSATPSATPAEHPFTNAARHCGLALAERWRARDWDGLAAMLDPRFRFTDRRAMFRIELDREQYMAFTRELGDMDFRRLEAEILATRGEHLVLTRLRIDLAGGDVGPSEIAFLQLTEVNERGLIVAYVRWDLGDLDAAYAELNARWRTAESPAHARVVAYQLAYSAALASRDWDALAALHAPTLLARDHRLVGWDVLEGPAAFLRAIRTLVEMAPDVRARFDHSRISGRGCIGEVVWVGTRDGGAFESPFLWAVELDADGRGQRFDFYDPPHVDRAFARFQELGASTSRPNPALATPNAASAAMDRWQAAFDVGLESDDWDAMRAVCAPGMTFDDRRRLALLSGDVDLMIASARERARMGARPERRLRGSAGARVAIENILWAGGPADGRFEIEYVGVVEVDAAGLVSSIVMFDLDDLGVAQREAYARWAAIDPAAPAALARFEELRPDPLRIPPNAATRAWDRWQAAFAARDHEAMRALYSPDHHFDDRRRLVRTTVDLEGALLTERFLTEGGWRAERTVLATLGDRLVLQHVIWRTGESGAESEIETLEINEVDHDGRHVRHVLFDPDDRAAASAEMFERYAASIDGPGQLAIEAIRAWNAHDLERFRALIPADFYLDDHRRTGVGRLEGADAYLASLTAVWELSCDLRIETLYLIAVEPHGTLYVCRWFGTNTEGGEFDAVYICLALARGDRPIGLEIFELDDVEEARARFTALGEIGSA